jgi:hypothetical protein
MMSSTRSESALESITSDDLSEASGHFPFRPLIFPGGQSNHRLCSSSSFQNLEEGRIVARDSLRNPLFFVHEVCEGCTFVLRSVLRRSLGLLKPKLVHARSGLFPRSPLLQLLSLPTINLLCLFTRAVLPPPVHMLNTLYYLSERPRLRPQGRFYVPNYAKLV